VQQNSSIPHTASPQGVGFGVGIGVGLGVGFAVGFGVGSSVVVVVVGGAVGRPEVGGGIVGRAVLMELVVCGVGSSVAGVGFAVGLSLGHGFGFADGQWLGFGAGGRLCGLPPQSLILILSPTDQSFAFAV